jgi:hypothetical protein
VVGKLDDFSALTGSVVAFVVSCCLATSVLLLFVVLDWATGVSVVALCAAAAIGVAAKVLIMTTKLNSVVNFLNMLSLLLLFICSSDILTGNNFISFSKI